MWVWGPLGTRHKASASLECVCVCVSTLLNFTKGTSVQEGSSIREVGFKKEQARKAVLDNGAFQQLSAPFLEFLITSVIACSSRFWGHLFTETPNIRVSQNQGH